MDYNQNDSDNEALLSYDNKIKANKTKERLINNYEESTNQKDHDSNIYFKIRNDQKRLAKSTKYNKNKSKSERDFKNISYLKADKTEENLLLFDEEPVNSHTFDIGLVAEFDSLDKHSTKKSQIKKNKPATSRPRLIKSDSDDSMINLENPNFLKDEALSHELADRSVSVNNGQMEACAASLASNKQYENHCHVPKNDAVRNKTVWRKLVTVLIMCIFFMIAEIIGGILARSISIQTDAAHMAADIAGFFFSIMAIYVSGKAPTRRMSFGYYRSEVLGALFSTLIIWLLTGVLVYLAIIRIIDMDFTIESTSMVATASCGVVFNIIMYFVLHTNKCFGSGVQLKHHGHSHSNGEHGHSHGDVEQGHSHHESSHGHGHEDSHPDEVATIESKDDASNINLRAAAIHVIGDFIQSIGVLIAATIIYFWPEYKIADPICTFIFSVLVIATTVPIVKDIYFVLMEALPGNLNYDSIIIDLCGIDNVKKAHSLHVWCLTMEKFALSVHLVIESDVDNQEILKRCNSILRNKYKIDKTTIQLEKYDELMDDCNDCKLPE